MRLHTAAPWSVCLTKLNGKTHIGARGIPTIATLETRHISFNQEQANASRIVECVNACEGIDNPAALQDFIREAYKLMLRCDRDEGMQSDGSNMSTLDLAMSLESLGVSSKIIEGIK